MEEEEEEEGGGASEVRAPCLGVCVWVCVGGGGGEGSKRFVDVTHQ